MNKKIIDVVVEINDNGHYIAVPQMNEDISFFGIGKTFDEAFKDLQNSYIEAKQLCPSLDEMIFVLQSS